MGATVQLEFVDKKTPTLDRVYFASADGRVRRDAVQGKHFSWGTNYNAVIAMAFCSVSFKAWAAAGNAENCFRFVGPACSPASSLRESVRKDDLPAWFREVFGERKEAERDRSYASSVFVQFRPPRKENKRAQRDRMSAMTIETSHYPANCFAIIWDGALVIDPRKLAALALKLASQGGWKARITEPNLGFLRKGKSRFTAKAAPRKLDDELLLPTESRKPILKVGAGTPKLLLTTNRDAPQWADCLEVELVGQRLSLLKCLVTTKSPYFRFGFKLLARDGDVFGYGAVKSFNKNLLVHVGRNYWNRPGIAVGDVCLTSYWNGVRETSDKRLFGSSDQLSIDVALSVDDAGVARFLVNGDCCYRRTIPLEICCRVVMLAWGDQDEFRVEISNLVVNPGR